MRSIDQLLHSRTRVRQRYALMPLEGFPTSRLPQWANAEVRILAAPALGARFAQYKIDLQGGGGTKQAGDASIETFVYVLAGQANLTIDASPSLLSEGGFALVPPKASFAIESTNASSLLLLRKRFEPLSQMPKAIIGNQANARAEAYVGNEHARLQTLIPDDLQYDFAINIFTFDPGHCLPYVETHVMEHGLLFLEGKGVYFLDGDWMEVQAGDFIWMAPYCPQTFYATGDAPARYIYYKNVNREIEL